MILSTIGKRAFNIIGKKAVKTVLNPLNDLLDQNLSDITTTIGLFAIRSIRGKFQRSITFSIGVNYADNWMEEALYGILYKYNNVKNNGKLSLTNKKGQDDGTGMYYQLDDGTHNLKYKNWDILLCIQSNTPQSLSGRISKQKIYTIITYDLSPDFVTSFENDMLYHRNAILKIRKDSPTINIYQDLHESDGYTYWEKKQSINKRKLNTIYLPREQKEILVKTINDFFASREYYIRHGIPHNLKILLYGEPGTGKSSIVKMIASEWNRNLYECRGGKNGKFIPEAIQSSSDIVNYPLFSISDIDKYPFLINEPNVEMDSDKEVNRKEENINYKQIFGNMINALDGIMSGEDKIIVMTTNHIEKFSDVFLRPGRVDLKLYITYITPEVFRKYTWDFYNLELPKDIKLKKKEITVADLQFDTVFLKMPVDEFIKKYVK